MQTKEPKNKYHTIIVGAGLAGLALAYKLKQAGVDFLLVENSSRLGGAFNSKPYASSLYEFGPNTIMNNVQEMQDLITELDLEDQIISTPFKDSKRYFCFEHGLVEVPVSPLKFFASPLLSLGAKLRLFAEPFITTKAKSNESIFEFISRRFGEEFARTIVSNFFQGIWGGDVNKLEARSTITKLYELDSEHGSVVKGLIKSPRKKKKQALKIISFKEGLSTLTNALAEKIGSENILIQTEISGARHPELYSSQLNINGQEISYDNLVLACPAYQAADLLAPEHEALALELQGVDYAPIALVASSIPKARLSFEAKGFGFLVANANLPKPRFSLGNIWSSEVFEERKVDGELLSVNILGGATHPEIKEMNKQKITELSNSELAQAMGVETKDITVIDSQLIPKAIPQYNLGHDARIKRIESLLTEIPGLHLASNYLHGVSVADTLKNSLNLVEQLTSPKTKDMVKS